MDIDSSAVGVGRPRIKTAFHIRLESYVQKTRKDSGCWFLRDPKKKILAVPGQDKYASIHRMLYASYIGPIPENVSLVAAVCGSGRCINPWHQEQVVANFFANSLDMEDVRLGQYEPRYSKARTRDLPKILPRDLTVFKVRAAKAMYRYQRASDQEIGAQLGLTQPVIRRIIGGFYDEAVSGVEVESPEQRKLAAAVGHGTELSQAMAQVTSRKVKQSGISLVRLADPDSRFEDGRFGRSDDASYVGHVGVNPRGVVVENNRGGTSIEETTDEEAWLAMNRGG